MKRQASLFIVAVVGASVFIYLVSSQNAGGPGFPLDDAWIHQTYARNLVRYNQWFFTPGIPSAGSTAPLWSAILALGFWLNINNVVWAYLVGIAGLLGVSVFGQLWFSKSSNISSVFPFVGIFLAGEWHLVWAALSGMETILYAAFILLFFLILTGNRHWLAGILVGLAIWLRPDAVTLIGPALFVYWFSTGPLKFKITQTIKFLAPVVGSLFIYALFNFSLSGSILPNTFFAKQAEYAILSQNPILYRIFDQIKLPLIGSGVMLLPGFIFFVWKSFLMKDLVGLAAVLWWFGFSLIYAIRLPVTYQYGRYLIPAMPVFFVTGVLGMEMLIKIIRDRGTIPATDKVRDWKKIKWATWQRIGLTAWKLVIVIIWLTFLFIGANQYQGDVGFIQTEMVAAANWLNEHAPGDARIASHDIGAIGFFAQRHVIDLAGLVSPDVIPFIRDQTRLAQYISEQGASYLMTFPGWYPDLVAGRKILYESGGKFSPALGGENMVIYSWP